MRSWVPTSLCFLLLALLFPYMLRSLAKVSRSSLPITSLSRSAVRRFAMPASAASLDAALRLSPHFEHLNSKALPKGYAPFKGQDKKYAVLESPIEKSENDQREYRCSTSPEERIVELIWTVQDDSAGERPGSSFM